MSKAIQFIVLSLLSIAMFINCSKKPKVISLPVETVNELPSTGIFNDNPQIIEPKNNNDDVHTVVIDEILPTEKYVYLYVKEGNDRYWIATAKKEIIKGEAYFYTGGLLKTNFESKEYDRIFDKIYLVSNIVPIAHGNSPTRELEKVNIETHSSSPQINDVVDVKGSTKISELVANPQDYDGKTIQLSGTCVKLNPNIMGRNWIHLQDGSMNDYDLVITSKIPIQEGSNVTLQGIVTLDKDFGAGYKYDIIVEDAALIN